MRYKLLRLRMNIIYKTHNALTDYCHKLAKRYYELHSRLFKEMGWEDKDEQV